jgi:hypothetical protein
VQAVRPHGCSRDLSAPERACSVGVKELLGSEFDVCPTWRLVDGLLGFWCLPVRPPPRSCVATVRQRSGSGGEQIGSTLAARDTSLMYVSAAPSAGAPLGQGTDGIHARNATSARVPRIHRCQGIGYRYMSGVYAMGRDAPKHAGRVDLMHCLGNLAEAPGRPPAGWSCVVNAAAMRARPARAGRVRVGLQQWQASTRTQPTSHRRP